MNTVCFFTTKADNVVFDAAAKTISAAKGTSCSYYRPSGNKGFFWNSGKIISVYSVKMPLKEKTVVALN